MFWAAPKFKNPPASKLATDFRPFDPGIIITQTCAISKLFCIQAVHFVYNHEKKAWDAVAGVNITLGLPIIRVSVDHGTAFDQAGTGKASELSLRNSIEYAVMFANNKK